MAAARSSTTIRNPLNWVNRTNKPLLLIQVAAVVVRFTRVDEIILEDLPWFNPSTARQHAKVGS